MEDKPLRANRSGRAGALLGGGLGRWREAYPKFISVLQAALGIGLRSALGCNAVNRRKVEAGTQAFLMAVA